MICFSFNHGFIAAMVRTMVIFCAVCLGFIAALSSNLSPYPIRNYNTSAWILALHKKRLKRHVSKDEPVRSNLIGYIAVGYPHNGPQTCRQRTRSAGTT